MNLNDYSGELLVEEQKALCNVLQEMDKKIDKLQGELRAYVELAKSVNVGFNPDMYGTKIEAENAKKIAKRDISTIQETRDELYESRVLLESENDRDGKDIQEYKIGLHERSDFNIAPYTLPVFRKVIFGNKPEFDLDFKDKRGEVIPNHYRILVKNNIKLRFANVKNVINQYPTAIDKELLGIIKDNKFFTDEFVDMLIRNYDPNASNDIDNARLITDQFLQELLERRSNPEFQNIVFSIQEKQSDIVQLPFKKNIIVQGCAGSGKSMIMLHRLPILLVDNPKVLARNSIYIISPSPAYIQMADSLRRQLEIEDINMGTMMQYYDLCIERYNRKTAGYGTVDRKLELSRADEEYIYSDACIADIQNYMTDRIKDCSINIDEAVAFLQVEYKPLSKANTLDQYVNNKLIEINKVIEKNKELLRKSFGIIRDVVAQAQTYSNALAFRKEELIRAICQLESAENEKIENANKELLKLKEDKNERAINNRIKIINDAKETLEIYALEKEDIENDKEYFDSLLKLHGKIDAYIESIGGFEKDFEKNKVEDVYKLLSKIPDIIGGYYAIEWLNSNIKSKYTEYKEPLSVEFEEFTSSVKVLESKKEDYLETEVFQKIYEAQKKYNKLSKGIIDDTYRHVFDVLGKADVISKKKAFICSPYLYLRIMLNYYGTSKGEKESLITIDEAQGMNPNELDLIKAVNGGNVIFNLYGDIKQHFEGKVGIDDWAEFNKTADFEIFELNENYRNASEITAFCNNYFNMNMTAINTTGNGVHEFKNDDSLKEGFRKKLVEEKRSGMSAIVVKDRNEVRFLNNLFSRYKEKFHDMTGDEYDLHRTRWNIISIDDAKGLEFNTILAMSGRMTDNEKYVAYTRALDELFVYDIPVEVIEDDTTVEKQAKTVKKTTKTGATIKKPAIKIETNEKPVGSEVREYFESFGLKTIDKRGEGGRLWVLGAQRDIEKYVNMARAKFGIMGQYSSSKESDFKESWGTKTKK